MTDMGGASASPDFLASASSPAGSFKLPAVGMGARWNPSGGYPTGEAEPFEGYKPVGLMRQPQSPSTAPLIQSKLLQTKADMEARQADIEKRLEVPAIISHMEASRKREQEAQAQINAYMETLNRPVPMMPDQIRANEGEALAGILGSLMGIRGDRAAGSVASLAGRRQQIGFQNQMAQDEAMRERARLGIGLEQGREEREGRRADSAMEFMAQIRQAAAQRAFAEEDWQKGRVAQLEDIQSERNWNREVMDWDKKTAIEKMRLADQLQLDSQKALGMFQAEVLAPLEIRNDARATGIKSALGALLENRDPARVTTLVRGMAEQGISLPPGFQTLFMGIAVANRDDMAFKKQMEKENARIQLGMFGLKVQESKRADAVAGAELAGAGFAAPSLQGGITPLPGTLPGANGGYVPIDPTTPAVVLKEKGGVELNLPDTEPPAITGSEIPELRSVMSKFVQAERDMEAANGEIALYEKRMNESGRKIEVLPASLKSSRDKAVKALEQAKADHRTALAKAKGVKGNDAYWAWVEDWRTRALEAIKALAESNLSPQVKRDRQAVVRMQFGEVTGVSISDIPGQRVK